MTTEIVISDAEQKLIEGTLTALNLPPEALSVLEAFWKAAYSSGRIRGVADVQEVIKGAYAQRQIQ